MGSFLGHKQGALLCWRGNACASQDKKTEDLAEMKRKMAQLQEQVLRLEREAGSASARSGTSLSASALPFVPSPSLAPPHLLHQATAFPAARGPLQMLGSNGVDPRAVHVSGVSQLAVSEVIAAHFSGCELP